MVDEVVEKVCKFYGVEKAEVAAAGKGWMASEVRGMMAWLVVNLRAFRCEREAFLCPDST